VEEVWRPARGMEGMFEVSDYGRFRSLPRVVVRSNGRSHTVAGRVLKLRRDSIGYWQVCFTVQGRRVVRMAHRVVAEAFLPAPQQGLDEINHIDGRKDNNAAVNLEWSNRSRNLLHAARLHLTQTGEGHFRTTLTVGQVRQLRADYAAGGTTHRELGVKYGVSHATAGAIIRGSTWKHDG
jgi:hypothetical protein